MPLFVLTYWFPLLVSICSFRIEGCGEELSVCNFGLEGCGTEELIFELVIKELVEGEELCDVGGVGSFLSRFEIGSFGESGETILIGEGLVKRGRDPEDWDSVGEIKGDWFVGLGGLTWALGEYCGIVNCGMESEGDNWGLFVGDKEGDGGLRVGEGRGLIKVWDCWLSFDRLSTEGDDDCFPSCFKDGSEMTNSDSR